MLRLRPEEGLDLPLFLEEDNPLQKLLGLMDEQLAGRNIFCVLHVVLGVVFREDPRYLAEYIDAFSANF